jgi:DNA-binding response OmpR family regulator
MSGKTILVVEDDPSMRELVRDQLKAAGHEVVTARDGPEAIIRLSNFLIHALILDLSLPGMDGFEVLKVIRGMPTLNGLPILVLTARHAERDVRRAVVMGAWDYLTKPYTEQQLSRRITRLLRGRFRAPTEASPEASPLPDAPSDPSQDAMLI